MDTVKYASKYNCILSTWNIGDEIDIKLPNGRVIPFLVKGFDHFENGDGNIESRIIFEAKQHNEEELNNKYTPIPFSFRVGCDKLKTINTIEYIDI